MIGPNIQPTPLQDWARLMRSGRITLRPEHCRVGVGNRLQERQARRNHANPYQVRDERGS